MKITEQELIQLERIMQMLSEGIDPTSGILFPNDTILNSFSLKKAFTETSEILQYLIQSGATFVTPSGHKAYKMPFHFVDGEDYDIPLSDSPISVSKLTWLINSSVASYDIKKIKATEITYWLVQKGYLQIEISGDNNAYKIPTEKGISLGISSIIKTNSAGLQYSLNLYSIEAQKFILDNINSITGWE